MNKEERALRRRLQSVPSVWKTPTVIDPHCGMSPKSTHTVHYFSGYSEATQCIENEFASKAFATTLDFEFLRDTFKPVARPIFQGWQNVPGGSTCHRF